MTITKQQNGTSLTLKIDGRLDSTAAPLLEKELNSLAGSFSGLTFDFAGLEYISSAGFRVLIQAYKIMHDKGNLEVVNANAIVRESFRLTGIDNIINVK